MRILLKNIRMDHYNINKRKLADEDILLIIPRKDKFQYDFSIPTIEGWEQYGEYATRSILCTLDGEIISLGHHKFPNFGETQKYADLFYQQSHERVFIKYDGHLIINFAHKGKRYNRTRGTVDGKTDHFDYGQAAEELLQFKKPIANHMQPLFELIGINLGGADIVVHYDKRELILHGCFNFNLQRYLNWIELEDFAEMYGLSLMKTYDCEGAIEILEKEFENSNNFEGVVVQRYDGIFPLMLKYKTEDYRIKHKLKAECTYKNLVNLAIHHEIFCESQLEQVLTTLVNPEFDWEILDSYREFYKEFRNNVERAKNLVQLIARTAANMQRRFNDKGDIARYMKSKKYSNLVFNGTMGLLTGKEQRVLINALLFTGGLHTKTKELEEKTYHYFLRLMN